MRSSRRSGYYALAFLILLAIAISFAAFAINNVNHRNPVEGNSESISESKSWSISEKISEKIPGNREGDISEKISLELSNNTSKKISNNKSINSAGFLGGNNTTLVVASKNSSIANEQKRKVVILSVGDDSSDGGYTPAASAGRKAANIEVNKNKNSGDTKENSGDAKEKSLAAVAVLTAPKTMIESHKGMKEVDGIMKGTTKSLIPGVEPSTLASSSGKNARDGIRQDQDPATSKAGSENSGAKADKSQSSGNVTSGTGGTVKSAPPETDGSAKSSEIGKEINSWVGTRSIGSPEKSQTPFKSKNIKYVNSEKGGRAVLGRAGTNPESQSSTGSSKYVKKLGR